MRHELAAAALAGVLLTTSCSGGGSEGAETDDHGLERAPVDVLVSGVATVTDTTSSDEGVVFLQIEHVLWSRGPHRNADGALVLPPAVDDGDRIALLAPATLLPGASYLVLADQGSTATGEPLLTAVGVVDPATGDLVVPFSPTPAELLLPGESGPEAQVNALVEILRDSARYHEAGDDRPPLTRRLAHAFRLAEVRNGRAATVGPDGVALDDFLLLDPSRRRLPSVVPDIVRESLGMTSFRARVILPEDYASRHWAIGFMTPLGMVGPIVLEPGQTVVDVEGFKDPRRAVRLVSWRSDPGPTQLHDSARKVGGPEFRSSVVVASRRLGEGSLLEIDVALRVVTARDAADVVAAPGSR